MIRTEQQQLGSAGFSVRVTLRTGGFLLFQLLIMLQIHECDKQLSNVCIYSFAVTVGEFGVFSHLLRKRGSMLLLPNRSTSWVESHLSCFHCLQSVLRLPISLSMRMLVVALAGAQTAQPLSMICGSCWPGHLPIEKDRRDG